MFRARIEERDRLIAAMDSGSDQTTFFTDVDGEYVYVRGKDIEVAFVSSIEGRKLMIEFVAMLDDEEEPTW